MTTATTSASTTARCTATAAGPRADIALLIVRIASGIVFLYHGAAILFGAFGGPGIGGFAKMVGGSHPVATLVGLAQLCGGAAILIGFPARIGAACVGVVMIGAILLIHLPNGFAIQNNGMEYAFTQLCIALAILVAGPGAFSVGAHLPPPWRSL